ncbi:MAG: helix-turn-helix domain-containing protein [Gammaproteobacteria bacterium]|nr:helix-turn-helix domain-containing protein [Gammaproteobacteria bacterium]
MTDAAAVSTFQEDLKKRCSTCSLRHLCLPLGLDSDDIKRLDDIISQRRKVPAGQHLFRVGDSLRSLAAVRTGFFKVYELGADGREQVSGFQTEGDLLGLDAISGGAHRGSALALVDAEVCAIPFDRLEGLLAEMPGLQRRFHAILSGTIVANQTLMMMLGTMRAEHRLATFLLDLSARLGARGRSPTLLHLPMSREDIGNYLGLKLETVSRVLSHFRDQGLIKVAGRTIEIRRIDALRALVSGVLRH